MKSMGLVAKATFKRKKTTITDASNIIVPNLLKRDFSAAAPNMKWVTDITYIKVKDKTLYLCVVLDLYSRSIVGWSIKSHMKAELVTDSLKMALFRRKMPQQVIIHSDKGSQYCSKLFRGTINKYNLNQSMSRVGSCYDNAACESFFHTLKIELIYGNKFIDENHLKLEVIKYIEIYYNRKRIHSYNYYKTPTEFENMGKIL